LVHPHGHHGVSLVPFINKYDLFKNNPGLTISPFGVQCAVLLKNFRDFVSALQRKPIGIKDSNLPRVSQPPEEFGFRFLAVKLSAHQRSPGLGNGQAAEVRSRIPALEERAGQCEHQLAVLQLALSSALRRVEADLARLAAEYETVSDTKFSNTARPAAVAPLPRTPTKLPLITEPAVSPPLAGCSH
jgi:hypothetical protein